MLEQWLLMPRGLMFATLAGGFILTAFLIYALSFNRWMRDHVVTYIGVVPPYVNVLAVLLALLTGFVASETWERQKHARQVVQSESDNVLAVYDLSIAAQSDLSRIRDALRKYMAAVLDDEWPRMAVGEESDKAADALNTLMIRVAWPKVGVDSGPTLQAALMSAALKIRSDRGERLALTEHHGDHTKWLVLLILGILTQCAIAIVHLDRPRAQAASMVIFTAGLISTLGLIAEHEWPFQGPAAIQPTALQQANKRIWKGGIEFTGPRAREDAAEANAARQPNPAAPSPAAPSRTAEQPAKPEPTPAR